jgi:hypothetical protein
LAGAISSQYSFTYHNCPIVDYNKSTVQRYGDIRHNDNTNATPLSTEMGVGDERRVGEDDHRLQRPVPVSGHCQPISFDQRSWCIDQLDHSSRF